MEMCKKLLLSKLGPKISDTLKPHEYKFLLDAIFKMPLEFKHQGHHKIYSLNSDICMKSDSRTIRLCSGLFFCHFFYNR